jgi:hypothetical protein
MADTLPFAGPIKERAKDGMDRLLFDFKWQPNDNVS